MENKTTKQTTDNWFMRLGRKIKSINIKRFVRKPYYYVPACPKCRSRMTGHFMRKLNSDYESNWRDVEALKNGEIIASDDNQNGKCFCLNCGNV